ncbi:hypothetical protein EYF80_033454 [Liparis tanakae]|uniref:Uncharacterized protein n=1 Tax=Liparis tanakae TaxID=230148 RepID=A0A4Z2GUC2_9TELE|nr:hypothetical protein EYF80_033454 [Liparis tanakae]
MPQAKHNWLLLPEDSTGPIRLQVSPPLPHVLAGHAPPPPPLKARGLISSLSAEPGGRHLAAFPTSAVNTTEEAKLQADEAPELRGEIPNGTYRGQDRGCILTCALTDIWPRSLLVVPRNISTQFCQRKGFHQETSTGANDNWPRCHHRGEIKRSLEFCCECLLNDEGPDTGWNESILMKYGYKKNPAAAALSGGPWKDLGPVKQHSTGDPSPHPAPLPLERSRQSHCRLVKGSN